MKQNYRLEDDELDIISGGAMRENVADSIKDMINLFKSQNYSKEDLIQYCAQCYGSDTKFTNKISTNGSDIYYQVLLYCIDKYWN